MKSVNSNFSSLRYDYLFPLINIKVEEYKACRPDADIINLGEANPAFPLCPEAVSAIRSAVEQLAENPKIGGYVPAHGFEFMRRGVCRHYAESGIELDPDEVFIGNGIKDDISNIMDLFGPGKTVLIPDPVYPVYLDTSIMAGHNIKFIRSGGENYLPMPDYDIQADIIYICSPCNPTGAAYSFDDLRAWVAYALDNNAVILFDAAFCAFVRSDGIARSIYQIDGAKHCAIEFTSFSKSAGFEGLRCGCTIIPHLLNVGKTELNPMWRRRQETKFGGVPYIIQRGAEAVLSEAGRAQIVKNTDYYMENARIMSDCLHQSGIWCCGGQNSPFVWMKCPGGLSSWDFFRLLLEKAEIVAVPGSGFGQSGEGYMRVSAFADRAAVQKATARFKKFIAENFKKKSHGKANNFIK